MLHDCGTLIPFSAFEDPLLGQHPAAASGAAPSTAADEPAGSTAGGRGSRDESEEGMQSQAHETHAAIRQVWNTCRHPGVPSLTIMKVDNLLWHAPLSSKAPESVGLK